MIYLSMLVFIGVYSMFSRRFIPCAVGLLPSICFAAWYKIRNDNTEDLKTTLDLNGFNIIAYKLYSFLKLAPYHNPIVFDFNAVDYFGMAYLISGMLFDALFVGSLAALAYVAVTRSSLRVIARKVSIRPAPQAQSIR